MITGPVRSVFPYGAFVLIDRDVDGLIPVAEISHSYTKDATQVYKVGDEVTAKIITFDDNKITLSVKALEAEKPEAEDVEITEEEYQEAKDILLMAFERAPVGKRLLYKLAEVSVKSGDIEEAEDFYREFVDLAPEDSRAFLLEYMILKAKGAPPAQLIHSLEQYTSQELDERCVAVICSLKATPETVKAVETANAKGAITIAMTGSMETGMAKVGQYVVVYSNGAPQDYSNSNQACSLRIGFELLHQIEGWDKYDKAMDAYQYINEIVDEAKKDCLPAAQAWAQKEKDEPVFYVLASGSNYGVAYSMCCCHFMEMQWKHAVCLHTGEYFHGPFETTDKKLPMVLIMGEGRTRALDERCLKFLKTYAENFIVIDFKELNKGRIDPDVVEFFNPVVLIPIERFARVQRLCRADHDREQLVKHDCVPEQGEGLHAKQHQVKNRADTPSCRGVFQEREAKHLEKRGRVPLFAERVPEPRLIFVVAN